MEKKYNILVPVLIALLIISILLNAYFLIYISVKLDITKPSTASISAEESEEEIERKWLINKDNILVDLDKADKFEILQTYISFSPEIRVRDINNGFQYILTIKSDMSADGLTRTEKEYYITKDEYENFLTKKEGNTINKTRYQIEQDGLIWAIDIFHEQLDGLAYLEIEFPDEETAKQFETPAWVIKDVTDDVNYKNGHLARYGIPIE